MIMNNSEISPKILGEYIDLFKRQEVCLLFYNNQVHNKVTEYVTKIAKANAIPIVKITEIMPTNENVIDWLIQSLKQTELALDSQTKVFKK